MTTVAPARAAASPADVDHRDGLDVLASAALALYSLVAALGFARVFSGWQFARDVFVIVVVGHGTSLLARRLHVRALLAMPITALALAWAVCWAAYPETFAAIFPTRETWDVAWADLALVRDQFRETVAPVEYIGGWALLAGIGTALAVFTGDTFAFHARARGEALVPGAVLFVFVAALGADRARVGLTVALIAAGFLAVAVLRVRFAQPPRTSLGRPRNPLALALPAVLVAGTAVAIGAWVVGPRLPGASAEPWFDTHSDGGGVTQVVSPFVDIRARLVNQSDVQMFTVAATEPAYWRLTTFPEFDGTTWRLPSRDVTDVEGPLSSPPAGAIEIRQEITVDELGGRFVPAAAEPFQATPSSLRWVADTSSLVRLDRPLESGDRYSIVSAAPRFTADALRAATSAQPPHPVYLELPSSVPQSVTDTAVAVTAGQSTVYDQMIALQDWFLTEFRYSTEIAPGQSTSAIEAFLRQRVGYCEQFSATFAAMARALGVPARVAMGYTWGRLQADGTYSVLGRNAHAWPEVWFDGLGWVAFEPTPGRGEPGAEAYTGVAPAQDETPPAPGAGDGTGVATEAPAVTMPAIPLEELPALDPGAQPDVLDAAGFTTNVPDPGTNWLVVGLVAAAIGLLVAVPALVRRWRRGHPPDDPARRMTQLWVRALGAVEATGCRVDPTLTPIEQARVVSPKLPVAARALRSLAEATTTATYAAPDDVAHLAAAEDDAEAAGEPGPRTWCRQVERISVDSMTTGSRLRRYFTIWT